MVAARDKEMKILPNKPLGTIFQIIARVIL